MIGNKVIKFNNIESTNTFIRNNIKKLNHGDVVVAKTQSKGKGRLGNVWLSEVGNLYFSFLLKENLERREIFSVIMRSSVVIVKLLRDYGINAQIKYPNDIVVNKKKISGILIESIGYNDINNLIVGIGININQKQFKNIDIQATSISKEAKKSINIDEVLGSFIKTYNKANDLENLYKNYLTHSEILGINVSYNNTNFIVKTILKNGNIVLKNQDNIEQIVDYGNISFHDFYNKNI